MNPKTQYLNSLTPSNPSATGTTPTTVAVPAYGSNVTDSTGNVLGTAKFNPNTGQALQDPNAGQIDPQSLKNFQSSNPGLSFTQQDQQQYNNSGTTSTSSAQNDYINTLKAARDQYATLAKPSDQENQTRIDLANLNSGYTSAKTAARQGYENTLNASGGLLSGAQQAATQEQRHSNADLANTSDQINAKANMLSALTGNREANTAYAQGQLDQLKPISATAGTSLVDPTTGKPVYGGSGAYTDKQAQDTYFNLQQTYPDAQIPVYDLNKSPQENLQAAQSAAAGSPSFGAKGLVAVKDAAGGVTFVDKKQVHGTLQQNNDGTYSLISSGQGADLKADTKSLSDQTSYRDTTQRALSNADAGLKQVIQGFSGKVNDNTIPVANIFANYFKYNLNPGDVSAYKAALAEVGNEYSQVFSRGGQVSDAVRSKSNDIINGNISVADLAKVSQELQTQGKIVIDGANQTISDIQGRLKNNSTGGSGTSGATGDPLGIL